MCPISQVLATDSAKHMGILGSLKTMVETKKISHGTLNPIKIEPLSEKMHVLKCLIHCADLSNPTRPTQLYEKWVGRLMEEFFRQVWIKNSQVYFLIFLLCSFCENEMVLKVSNYVKFKR